MQPYPIYCGGEFVTSNDKLSVISPYNGNLIATTYLADGTILDKAIIAAQQVRSALQALSAYEKSQILQQIADTIFTQKNELAELLASESGKPMVYASAEIERSIQTFRIAAEECKRLPKEYISLDWTKPGIGKEGIIKYFPIGLVAAIAPFNFPMNLAVHKLAPAIATGCPIILKPASSTPLSTLALAKIIDATALPKGAVSILPMNRTVGNKLVTDDRFQLLTFTGSPQVGWQMKSHCGKKKVVLELGGNAAVIITNTANLQDALRKSIVGAFAYSGQICIHAQRFIVHSQLFDVFTEGLLELTQQLTYGDPLNPATTISHMIDEENAIRVEAWIQEAIQQGAQLLCGGKRKGTYVEPTILINTKADMKVYSEEVFGPVICIERYDGDIADAVQKANNTKFGLQCGVFTNSISELDYCFNHLEVGGVIHNDVPTLRFDHMPYGGIKDSGLGREGVKYAMQDMLELKILVK